MYRLFNITVVVVLIQQEAGGGGANAVTGMQESYYSQNKGRTKEGILKKIMSEYENTLKECSKIAKQE